MQRAEAAESAKAAAEATAANAASDAEKICLAAFAERDEALKARKKIESELEAARKAADDERSRAADEATKLHKSVRSLQSKLSEAVIARDAATEERNRFDDELKTHLDRLATECTKNLRELPAPSPGPLMLIPLSIYQPFVLQSWFEKREAGARSSPTLRLRPKRCPKIMRG